MANIDCRKRKDGTSAWRVSIRKKGFPHIEKTFDSEEEAKAFADTTEKGFEISKTAKAEVKLPFKVWANRWRSEEAPKRKYAYKEVKYIDFWEKHIGNLIANDISPSYIDSLADEVYKINTKYKKPPSHETRRKYLLILSSIYSKAIKDWRWATFNPLSQIRMIRRDEVKTGLEEEVPKLGEFRVKLNRLIDEKRKALGINLRDAANLCKMSLHTFQCVMNLQVNPTIKNVLKACNGLGINLSVEIKNEEIRPQ